MTATAGRVPHHQLPFPDVEPGAIQAFAAAVLSVSPAEPPTPRELEVAYLAVIAGLRRREIAEQLTISLKTAEAHWRNLAAKAECGGHELLRRLLSAYWWQAGYSAAAGDPSPRRPATAGCAVLNFDGDQSWDVDGQELGS